MIQMKLSTKKWKKIKLPCGCWYIAHHAVTCKFVQLALLQFYSIRTNWKTPINSLYSFIFLLNILLIREMLNEKSKIVSFLKRYLPFCSRVQNCILRDVEEKRKSYGFVWRETWTRFDISAIMSRWQFWKLDSTQYQWSCTQSAK